MAGPRWKNIYNLSDEQVEKIDSAERLMEMMQINEAEEMLKEMLGESPDCVPVLNILLRKGHHRRARQCLGQRRKKEIQAISYL